MNKHKGTNMNHRSYGESKDCKGCRFWSEMMAGTDANTGALRAVCLSMSSVQAGKWTIGSNSCAEYASGHDGAIDEPGSNPMRYAMEHEG